MIPWISGHEKKRVAVIGDLILDEYFIGDVNRISPEAPVPVHLVRATRHAAGGAGNSARNLSLCGANVSIFSVWGNDEAAQILKTLFLNDQTDISGILALEDRPTIRKTRVATGAQQLLRLDWETPQPLPPAIHDQLYEHFQSTLFDAVLISDYGKGALSGEFLARIFSHCRKHTIPVIVDPKGTNFHRYRGCNLLTPNLREACEALGCPVPEDPDRKGPELAQQLQERFDLEDVLITMGAQGMLLQPGRQNSGSSYYEAPRAREVFDVSGAGDTVAAIMTLCKASGTTNQRSVHLANIAAGLVVEKWGTHPIDLKELSQAVRRLEDPQPQYQQQVPFTESSYKIQTKESLLRTLAKEACKKKIIFTNGCFDILHAGHLSYLETARSLGHFLIIGLNSDESIRTLKGPDRPIIPLEQRARLLAGLSCVDAVIPFSETTPESLIRFVRPDILVKGSDYQDHEIIGADFVRSIGGSVHRIPLWEGLSTSGIIKTLKQTKK